MTNQQHALARSEQRAIRAVDAIDGDDSYRPLSVYQGGRSEAPIRREVLATLSAGYRQAPRQGESVGLPARTEDGRIYVHGDLDRVPNLLATLEAREHKGLTITFPSDDEREFIADVYLRYSKTRLEAFGDELSVTTIELIDTGKKDAKGAPIYRPDRHTYTRLEQPERYEQIVRTCKAYYRIAFYLMVWQDGTPLLDLSDGVAPYGIRTTSPNSINSLRSAIRDTKALTSGRVAGIPFECWIDPKREVAGPDGVKRRIPVWRFATRSPQGIRLTPPVWRQMARTGLEQRDMLMLPAEPTEAEFADEPEDVAEPDEQAVSILEQGGRCDARYYEGAWFATVRDSALASDAARAAFVRAHTGGRTESLATFLAGATDEEASALIVAASGLVARERTQQHADRYAAVFGDDDGEPVVPAPPEPESEPEPETIEGTAEEIDPYAPEPEPVEMVTSGRDKTLQRYAEVMHEAARLDVPYRAFKLPVAKAEVEAETTKLADAVAAKKRALAADQPTPQPTEEPGLPF